jgi:four helix bundle protein
MSVSEVKNHSVMSEKKSIVGAKAYSFALEIVIVYKQVTAEKKEFVLSKQLLRAGTSIGANVNEAISGVSKRDFIHKLGIALKEARETSYWLNLLKDSSYISIDTFSSLHGSCNEIIRMLSSIILTIKEKYFKTDGSEL